MSRLLILLAFLLSPQLASAQFIPPPDLPTSNCGLPCATDQDCDDYETDLKPCLQCMPQGVCGNPSCFDTCATSNGCPSECPICSFQQCVGYEEEPGRIGCSVAPAPPPAPAE